MVGGLPELSMNAHRPSHLAAEPTPLAVPPPVSRADHLRLEWLSTVDSLQRRRADLVADGYIEDYVALHWLEWNGGALRVTVTGTNISEQMRARLN